MQCNIAASRTIAKAVMAGFVLAFGGVCSAQESVHGDHAAKRLPPLVATYSTPPARAKAAPGTACEAAERYVTLQGSGRQSEIAALFAEDADVLAMGAGVMHGHAVLAQYFSRPVNRPVIPITFIDKGRECFMELAAANPDDPSGEYRLAAIDHFTLDESGLVKRLIIYLRPIALR